MIAVSGFYRRGQDCMLYLENTDLCQKGQGLYTILRVQGTDLFGVCHLPFRHLLICLYKEKSKVLQCYKHFKGTNVNGIY